MYLLTLFGICKIYFTVILLDVGRVKNFVFAKLILPYRNRLPSSRNEQR